LEPAAGEPISYLEIAQGFQELLCLKRIPHQSPHRQGKLAMPLDLAARNLPPNGFAMIAK
jgi:hypothetical protein